METNKCPKCHTENPIGACFCRHCGNILNDSKEQRSFNVPDVRILSKLSNDFSKFREESLRLLNRIHSDYLDMDMAFHQSSIRYYTHLIYISIIILCVIGGGFLYYSVHSKNKSISYLENLCDTQSEVINKDKLIIQNLQSSSADISSSLKAKDKEFNELTSVYPFLITSVDIKNEGEEYGATIYSKNTTFIYGRVNIKPYVSRDIIIFVKFICPDGKLSTNENSPSGYSYSHKISIEKGKITNFEHYWGNKNPGFWKSGQYYLEFWYNNKCFYRRGFYIHS